MEGWWRFDIYYDRCRWWIRSFASWIWNYNNSDKRNQRYVIRTELIIRLRSKYDIRDHRENDTRNSRHSCKYHRYVVGIGDLYSE